MSRLSDITARDTLRNYAQGAAQKAIATIANFLAPTVETAGPVFSYKRYGKGHRFKVPNTKRPLLGRAVEIRGDAENVLAELQPHAIDAPVDRIEMLSDDGLENSLKSAADSAAMVGALSHEREVVAAALNAAGAGTDFNFTSNSVNPIDIIDEAILNVMRLTGCGSFAIPRILYGATAWRRYKNNANVLAAFLGGGGGKGKAANEGNASLRSPQLNNVSTLQLNEPEAKMSLMVYDSAQEGKTASNSFVLDEEILVFCALENPTLDDPSFMKTFRPRGAWMVPGSYMRDDQRVEVAKMDWLSRPEVTNSVAVIRINAKNS